MEEELTKLYDKYVTLENADTVEPMLKEAFLLGYKQSIKEEK